MKKYITASFLGLSIFATSFFSTSELTAKTNNPYAIQSSPSRKYSSSKKHSNSKLVPYASYGQPSKVNGMPKYKMISGHTKRTSKGYGYVSPYYRSK